MTEPLYAFDSPRGAVEALLERVVPVDAERAELTAATGRVLAEAVVADRPSPPVDVSAMDGFAVRAAEARGGELPIAGEVRIGRPPPEMPLRTALRIVTGGALPAGADAVVRHEDTRVDGGRVRFTDTASIHPGLAVRRRGENIAPGERVIDGGTLVTPPVTGALASFGVTRPLVRRRVRVGVLTTGDELVPPESAPTAYQLRDSNGPGLGALLAARPHVEALPPRRGVDDPAALTAAARELLDSADVLLLTGGVSMGERDFVPGVLRTLGARVLFHKVPQRPGKPILAARLPDGRTVLALPGNPVSVLVTARRFAVPLLDRLSGRPDEQPPQVLIERPDAARLDLWWHRIARLVKPGVADLVPGRGSGDIVSAARADGFVEIPPGEGGPGPWPFMAWAS